MARKATETTTDTSAELSPQAAEILNEVQVTAAVIQSANNIEQNLVNQLLGQAQAAESLAKISRTISVSKLAYVKEIKAYRALAGQANREGKVMRGTWEEFCGLLGMSVDKADVDIKNLREFGEEALESMNQMGIGYRAMRQYRMLPEDEKTALIEAAKSGDKDSFIDLAEEIISKHAKEKELLTERAIEAEESLDDKERVLNEKNQQIDEMAVKLQRIRKMPKNEVSEELRKECSAFADDIEELMRHQLRKAFEAIGDHVMLHEEYAPEFRDFMSARLDLLDDALLFLRAQVGIERTTALTNEPAWAQGDDDEQ